MKLPPWTREPGTKYDGKSKHQHEHEFEMSPYGRKWRCRCGASIIRTTEVDELLEDCEDGDERHELLCEMYAHWSRRRVRIVSGFDKQPNRAQRRKAAALKRKAKRDAPAVPAPEDGSVT